MLRSLIGRRQRPAAADIEPAAIPPGIRVYAVGDIHGSAHLLDALLEGIIEDARSAERPAPARKLLVFLGDYVDRGLESPRVLDTLIAGPPDGFEQICLMGNHEEAMFGFLEDIQVGPMWLRNGGGETLLSYGVSLPAAVPGMAERLEAARLDLRAKLPQAHLGFLKSLALFHVEGGYLFVHAGIRPKVALADQHRNDMLWIRDEFLTSRADFGHVVVHGHTIAPEPQIRANRIGIDTGAYATGVLTCLVLEGTERRFLRTGWS
ncbi:MAG: metallophosphoesterase family protein [Alphaproteobacteria bacterium]